LIFRKATILRRLDFPIPASPFREDWTLDLYLLDGAG
jgi:hypothetical protein